jgi:hypothetical protein
MSMKFRLDAFVLISLAAVPSALRAFQFRGRLEKRIAKIVSSNNVNVSIPDERAGIAKAQDSDVTSRPRVKHTRT